MRILLFTVSIFVLSVAAAKSDEADYSVPVPPELSAFAEFTVKINQPYVGPSTTQISYTFPKELTGDPALTVTLKRVPGTINDWESPQMTARCEEANEVFTCEMHLVKQTENALRAVNPLLNLGASAFGAQPALAQAVAIDKDNVVEFLTASAVSAAALRSQLDVLDIFLSSEPAGILTYEFEPYPGSN